LRLRNEPLSLAKESEERLKVLENNEEDWVVWGQCMGVGFGLRLLPLKNLYMDNESVWKSPDDLSIRLQQTSIRLLKGALRDALVQTTH